MSKLKKIVSYLVSLFAVGSMSLAQNVDIRHLYITNDVSQAESEAVPVTWFQGESVKMDLWLVRGTRAVNYTTTGTFARMEAFLATNTTTAYIMSTGTIANTNGYITFDLPPDRTTLPARKYNLQVRIYQTVLGTNRYVGTCLYSDLNVVWSSATNYYNYVGPFTNSAAEYDPVWAASASAGITAANTNQWTQNTGAGTNYSLRITAVENRTNDWNLAFWYSTYGSNTAQAVSNEVDGLQVYTNLVKLATNNLVDYIGYLYSSNNAQELRINNLFTSNDNQQVQINSLFTSNDNQQVQINDLFSSNANHTSWISDLYSSNNTQEARINDLFSSNTLQQLTLDTLSNQTIAVSNQLTNLPTNDWARQSLPNLFLDTTNRFVGSVSIETDDSAGYSNIVANQSLAIGYGNEARGKHSLVVGAANKMYGTDVTPSQGNDTRYSSIAGFMNVMTNTCKYSSMLGWDNYMVDSPISFVQGAQNYVDNRGFNYAFMAAYRSTNINSGDVTIFGSWNLVSNKAHYTFISGRNNVGTGNTAFVEGASNQFYAPLVHVEGYMNVASGECSHVEGGYNLATGTYAHVQGYGNTANGFISHAAGARAMASNEYTFVWSDGTVYGSHYTNSFNVKANGGIFLDNNVSIGGNILSNAVLSNSVYISDHILPTRDNTYDLGSGSFQFRDVYISGASLYMKGVKTLSSDGTNLTINIPVQDTNGTPTTAFSFALSCVGTNDTNNLAWTAKTPFACTITNITWTANGGTGNLFYATDANAQNAWAGALFANFTVTPFAWSNYSTNIAIAAGTRISTMWVGSSNVQVEVYGVRQ